jgi:8-oxo-dGTP diphosphatase
MNGRPDNSREYPSRPLFGVGALIIEGDSIVLVTRGRNPSKGEWSIPGGLVKIGETISKAVMREVLEETGLQVEQQALVELLERIFPDDRGKVRYHYIIAEYLCRVVGGELKAGSDAQKAVWVAQRDLHRYSLAPITLEVILKGFAQSRK